MPYYAKVLQAGETVQHLGRLHWIVFWKAIPALILAVALAIVGMVIYDPQILWLPYVFDAAALLSLLIAIVQGFAALLRCWTTEIVVTDRRILFKTGLISRHTVEMNTTKIETVDVDQPIVGRMLDFGTVTVRGTGSSMEPMRQVSQPLQLRNTILVG